MHELCDTNILELLENNRIGAMLRNIKQQCAGEV